MPDAQLLDYIRQQDAAGVPRESTLDELLAIGWIQTAVDAAFAALPLSAAEAPVPTSQLPAYNFFAPRKHAETSASAVAEAIPLASLQPASKSVPQTPSGNVSRALSGPFALIGEGFSAYRASLAAVLVIGSLSAVLVLAAQLGFFGLTFAGGLAALVSGNVVAAVVVALVILAPVLFVIWLLSVFLVGIAHALDRSPSAASAHVGSALRAAVSQGLSYIWLSFVSTAVYLGYLIVLCFVPATIIFIAVTFAVSSSGMVALVVAGVYAFVTLLLVSVVVWTRYVTALWIMVEGEGRGAHALMLSARRVKLHLGALAWRLVVIGFLYGLAYVVASFVLLLLVTALLPVTLAMTVQAVLTSVLNYLFFAPILLGISLAVHRQVKDNVPASDFDPIAGERWSTYGAAALGPVMMLTIVILVILFRLGLLWPPYYGGRGAPFSSWAATSTSSSLPPAQNTGN